jgi:23S rRNA pseudouridine2605 synthase
MKGNNPKKQFFKGDNAESQPKGNTGRGESRGRGRKSDSGANEFDLGKRSFDSKDTRSSKPSFDKKKNFSSDSPKSFGEKKFGGKYQKPEEGSFGKKPSFSGKKEGFSGNKFEKRDESGFSKKPGYKGKSDKFSSSDKFKKDDFGPKKFGKKPGSKFDKPLKKEGKTEYFGSKEDSAGLVYKGRGRDQKPVFAPGKPKKFEGKSENAGFEKKRFKSNAEAQNDRPDYNFDQLPAKKVKSKTDDGLLRLNKYIANSGICGRREADQLIAQGLVSVNGVVITELGHKVNRTDRVVYQGRKINPEKPVYVLLNKPKDFITTTEDPLERKTVMNLVGNACEERIFPVGRLDRNTTGLLLFTNDGELAAKLSHPSNQIKKIYQVTLDKPLTHNDEKEIQDGLTLEDGDVQVDDMKVLSVDRKILGLEIHVGRNRIVRRIFAHLGYEVTALDRVVYAGLDKKDLKRGHYRFLSEQEVIRLKFFI